MPAAVAELADALDSGSSARKGMEVQVLSAAPTLSRISVRFQKSKYRTKTEHFLKYEKHPSLGASFL
jgi:hypothetical protein